MNTEAPDPGSSPHGAAEGSGASSFSVRAAMPEDAAAVARVAAITFPLACPPSSTAESQTAFIEANLTEAHFAQHLRDPLRRLLVAEDHGELIGYTMLVLPSTPDADPSDADVVAAVRTRPTSELSKVYVLAGHHGGGVARALVEQTLDLARESGVASVWLGVNQLNDRANAFYAKCGFARAGTKRFLVGDVLEHDFVREHVFAAARETRAKQQPGQ